MQCLNAKGAVNFFDVSGVFFFSSRRRHTRCSRDWSSDVCSSDLTRYAEQRAAAAVLGVKEVVFLGFRDGHLEPNVELRRAISREIRRYRPELVLRSEEHTSELQSRLHLVCRLLLEKKKTEQPRIL